MIPIVRRYKKYVIFTKVQLSLLWVRDREFENNDLERIYAYISHWIYLEPEIKNWKGL